MDRTIIVQTKNPNVIRVSYGAPKGSLRSVKTLSISGNLHNLSPISSLCSAACQARRWESMVRTPKGFGRPPEPGACSPESDWLGSWTSRELPEPCFRKLVANHCIVNWIFFEPYQFEKKTEIPKDYECASPLDFKVAKKLSCISSYSLCKKNLITKNSKMLHISTFSQGWSPVHGYTRIYRNWSTK